MVQNSKGQTALHLACENNETFAIDLLLTQGGKNLAWMQDNEGNTALHYLKQDGGTFKDLKLILQAGGMDLLRCRNNKQEEAFNNQFLIQAIEFQPDKKKLQASVAKLERERNDMDDLKHKHERDTSQIKKLKKIEKSQRNEIDELKALIKKLEDDAKEKDIELKIFKAMYENSKANETFLVEQLREMKEKNTLKTSTNEQENDCKDLEQNASVGKKHVLIEDNYNIASKRHKQVTFSTEDMFDKIFRDLYAMKKDIKDLKMA
jgi:ankyrin repeat protein